ncbi:uncharacterized protein DFL_006245 [Arthrobotrys flagrans]|uniref:DNA primase n=1 Tax=Arthrobotrys flagrans TaxID=97331 RepID=A0A437A0N5_ARTFL|nr:hypothetical protein DFL_006245 [Arthrobotrys flagrans]
MAPHKTTLDDDGDDAMQDVDSMQVDSVGADEKTAVKDELEHMFDDDLDDEPMVDASNIYKNNSGKANTTAISDILSTNPSDPQIMLQFYSRLFPWRQLYRWLNHSDLPSTDFAHREFAFTLHNEAYLRYQSYPTFETLRRDVLKLNPSRFEIGPVYSARPRDRKQVQKGSFKPIEKELVFDIDLTDYDEIRTCCSKTKICIKCWQFVTMAIKVVDVALRDDFGFQHIMWVYSGRRGAHAWVCDKKARKLDDGKRRAITAYFEVVKGGSQSGKKVNLDRPLHPHIRRSHDILKDDFRQNILENQDPFRTEKQAERLLQLLPDRQLNEALREKWDSTIERPSSEKWKDIDALAGSGASKTIIPKVLLEHKQDIILEYTYPRLDAEVSKHLNHLLKSPFVVHPGTGKVCVPIDISKLDEFDPDDVPTVTQLLKEIDQWKNPVKKEEDGDNSISRVSDIDKTSLKPYHDLFSRFVQKLLNAEKSVNKKTGEIKTEGMDF